MTSKQLKKILNGLTGVTINSRDEIEIFVECGDYFDSVDATETLLNEIRNRGLMWGGYKTGYGAWVLQRNSKPKGDWNDKSSEMHY